MQIQDPAIKKTSEIPQSISVMVIDDSSIVIERLVPALEELPNVNQVIKGENYEDGERLLSDRKTDVAILDINLPGKTGIELLKLIREKYPQAKMVVIMMTDDPTENKKNICMQAGADYFIDKFEGFESILHIVSDIPVKAEQ